MSKLRIKSVPGLHKHLGVWGFAKGILRPSVYIDPLCEVQKGGDSLIIHEAAHVRGRHALKGVLCLVVAPFLYPLWRRRAETIADREAFRLMGQRDFHAFTFMHNHPTSWWGRLLYEDTPQARIRRAENGRRGKGTDREPDGGVPAGQA